MTVKKMEFINVSAVEMICFHLKPNLILVLDGLVFGLLCLIKMLKLKKIAVMVCIGQRLFVVSVMPILDMSLMMDPNQLGLDIV